MFYGESQNQRRDKTYLRSMRQGDSDNQLWPFHDNPVVLRKAYEKEQPVFGEKGQGETSQEEKIIYVFGDNSVIAKNMRAGNRGCEISVKRDHGQV